MVTVIHNIIQHVIVLQRSLWIYLFMAYLKFCHVVGQLVNTEF
jgi:hypothetical protein